MLYKLLYFCCLITCTLAAPSPDGGASDKQAPTVIPIVSQSEELEPNGTYKFSYETGNGIKREETSYDKILPKGRSASSNEGGESGSGSDESDEIHVQQGSYSYTAPDGTLISVRYIADENGFQPIGTHIPRVPGPASDSGNSGEKSGRALKSADSAGAGSAPAIVSKSAASDNSPAPQASESTPATEESKTSATTESQEKPTENASETTTDLNKNETTKAAETQTESASTQTPEESPSSESAQQGSSTVAGDSSTTVPASSTAAEGTSTNNPETQSTSVSEESQTEASTVSESATSSASEPTSEASTSAAASTSDSDSSTTQAATSTYTSA